MMRLFAPCRLIAPALFLATGLLVVAADGSAFGQPGKKDKEKKEKDKGPDKAGKDLRKAFDSITDLSQFPVAGKEPTRVFDHAKRFYREAVKLYPNWPSPRTTPFGDWNTFGGRQRRPSPDSPSHRRSSTPRSVGRKARGRHDPTPARPPTADPGVRRSTR
jgi:hypothetical protein